MMDDRAESKLINRGQKSVNRIKKKTQKKQHMIMCSGVSVVKSTTVQK